MFNVIGWFPGVGHILAVLISQLQLYIIVVAGIIAAILAALIAIFKKRGIGKIFVYALLGFVIGLPIGYILAPFILSFY